MILKILIYQNGVPVAILSAFVALVGFIFFYRTWKKTPRWETICMLAGFSITAISTMVFQIIAIRGRYQDPDHVFRNHPQYLKGLLHVVTGFADAGSLIALIGFIGAFNYSRETSEKNKRPG